MGAGWNDKNGKRIDKNCDIMDKLEWGKRIA
jgi:hypothetical protein